MEDYTSWYDDWFDYQAERAATRIRLRELARLAAREPTVRGKTPGRPHRAAIRRQAANLSWEAETE